LKECNCNELVELKEFGSPGHFLTTYNAMENNVINGYYKEIGHDGYEKKYQCMKCKDIWIMGIPEYPVKRYFFRTKR
jgi:hypothetical protein